MLEPEQYAQQIDTIFNKILHEQMVGIPILNPVLYVQTIGFQAYQERCIGIVICPWLMNLVMFPKQQENWNVISVGKKIPHKFPAKTLKFMLNEFDGVGKIQTYSIYSPMHEFTHQEHAVAAATSFLDTLMIETEPSESDKPQQIEAVEPLKKRAEQPITRRELLRGTFLSTQKKTS